MHDLLAGSEVRVVPLAVQMRPIPTFRCFSGSQFPRTLLNTIAVIGSYVVMYFPFLHGQEQVHLILYDEQTCVASIMTEVRNNSKPDAWFEEHSKARPYPWSEVHSRAG
jgi:hypothetical protein